MDGTNTERPKAFWHRLAPSPQPTHRSSDLPFRRGGGASDPTSAKSLVLLKQALLSAILAAGVTLLSKSIGIDGFSPLFPAALFLIGSTRSGRDPETEGQISASKGEPKKNGEPLRFDSSSSPHSKPALPERGQMSWKLFASLSLPGENAAFTLHDGSGALVDATEAAHDIWKLPINSLIGSPLDQIFQSSSAVRSWLLDLEKATLECSFSTTAIVAGIYGAPVLLKRIPLFISSDPSKTRVIMKTILARSDAQRGHVSTPSSTHSISGAFEASNMAWTDLAGYTSRELGDRPLSDFVIPEDVELAKSLFKRAVEADRPARSLLRIAAKDGSIRTIMTSIVAASDSPSLYLTGKELTLKDGRFDSLTSSIELIREGVVILAREKDGFRIQHVNQAFESTTGYKNEDAKGATISKFTGPKTNARALGEFEKAVGHEAQHECELILYRKDGEPFWTKTSMYPLRNDEGIATHCVVVVEDTSEMKAVAEELAQKNIELERAVANLKQTQKTIIRQENLRALGQMASGIAHDFNNLLAPILGFSELLLNTPASSRDEKKLESFLKKIQVAAQDGAAVVSRLREFYRSQNNDEDLTLIELPTLIEQVKELTRHRWKNQAEAQGIRIQFNVEVSARRRILANEPELRQVLTNLVINAVDATKGNGAITIRVYDERKRVCIEVIDTGTGMPPEVRKNCLEPFYTTKGKLGTGLGLSIVYGVVQRLNGKFDIQSKEGKGTTIRMSFPIARSQDPQIVEGKRNSDHASLRIMLVDDEEVLLEVISELLTASGHQVRQFADPVKALESFEQEDYDLIITDRAMPEMSGDKLATEIRRIDPEVAIFMITGFGDMIKETGAMPEHVDEVLCKPVPLDLLRRRLSELANQKR